jgi:hypothetical protein
MHWQPVLVPRHILLDSRYLFSLFACKTVEVCCGSRTVILFPSTMYQMLKSYEFECTVTKNYFEWYIWTDTEGCITVLWTLMGKQQRSLTSHVAWNLNYRQPQPRTSRENPLSYRRFSSTPTGQCPACWVVNFWPSNSSWAGPRLSCFWGRSDCWIDRCA